jgi:hypothetical protein
MTLFATWGWSIHPNRQGRHELGGKWGGDGAHGRGLRRARVGAIGRHLAGVAGMWPPRGASRLTRSGVSARGGGRRRVRRGPGPRRPTWAGVGSAGAGRKAGPALASGPDGRRWPVR